MGGPVKKVWDWMREAWRATKLAAMHLAVEKEDIATVGLLGRILRAIWKILEPIVAFIKQIWSKIMSFYNTHIRPWLEKLEVWIRKLEIWIERLEKTLLGRILRIVATLELYFNTLRKWIREGLTKLERLIRGIDEKLANKIADIRDKLLKIITEFENRTIGVIRDLIGSFRRDIHRTINELKYSIQVAIDSVREIVSGLDNLIKTTFEAPQILSKDTIFKTTKKYGAELFEGIMGWGVPEPRPEEWERLRLPRYSKELEDIVQGIEEWDVGLYQDLVGWVECEIEEIETGKEVLIRPEVETPKLESIK